MRWWCECTFPKINLQLSSSSLLWISHWHIFHLNWILWSFWIRSCDTECCGFFDVFLLFPHASQGDGIYYSGVVCILNNLCKLTAAHKIRFIGNKVPQIVRVWVLQYLCRRKKKYIQLKIISCLLFITTISWEHRRYSISIW